MSGDGSSDSSIKVAIIADPQVHSDPNLLSATNFYPTSLICIVMGTAYG